MTTRIVHQFPVSHFCEKTRWHLDHKGLSYEARNQLPGFHILTNRRLSGKQSVPLLRDGQRTISGSSEIAIYLDQQYPDRPLLPEQPEQRARALELDRYFNDTFGIEVRRYCYGIALRLGKTRSVFFGKYGPVTRTLAAPLLTPVLERTLTKMYRINDATVAKAKRVIDEACERLERELAQSGGRYLVGDQLSIADVCAASLLAPAVAPPTSPWGGLEEMDPELRALCEEMRARPAGKWVMERYQRDR